MCSIDVSNNKRKIKQPYIEENISQKYGSQRKEDVVEKGVAGGQLLRAAQPGNIILWRGCGVSLKGWPRVGEEGKRRRDTDRKK